VLVDVHIPKLVMLAQPPMGGYFMGNRSAESAELESRWQNGEVIIFEETGHFIHSERPEQFLDAVQQFFMHQKRGG
jgi:pimeloyl-ACP methyl ester carboxylesterase